MGNTESNSTTPQPVQPLKATTTQNYLEAADRVHRCWQAVQEALLASDTTTLEARLGAFSQARKDLAEARAAMLEDAARWVRAMFRPWKGVRHG